jgi:formylmethanofuran dehydrogenase subunit E
LGKVAATFVDTVTGQSVRVVPRQSARALAAALAPEARNRWEAQLLGYQRLPSEQLLDAQAVCLKTPIAKIVSRAGHKVICACCGEEILNEREVPGPGGNLCRTCAGHGYYTVLAPWARLPAAQHLAALEAAPAD